MRSTGITGILALLLAFAASTHAQESATIPPARDEAKPPPAAWTEWRNTLWCGLLDHPAPMVSLRVQYLIQESGESPAGPIRCQDALPDRSDFRRDALEGDPENPALIAMVYRLECARSLPATWCREADLRQQLLAADPNNAYPHLLYLDRSGARKSQATLTFSGEELEQLLEAASSETFNTYWGKGMPEAYEALEAAVSAQSPDVWSPEIRAYFEEIFGEIADTSAVVDLLSIQLMLYELGTGRYELLSLENACQAAQQAGDDIAVTGCRALGDLAERRGHTLVAQRVGQALVSRSGDESGEDDWRRQIDVLIRTCATPRGRMGSDELPGPMPEGELLQYYRDLADFGENVAMRRKALREYALYPEAFPMNPERCEEIGTLPEDQQEALARRWENSTGDGRSDAALKRAAAMLD
jgi:hypothetical protein